MLMFQTLPNCPGGGGGGSQSVPSRISVVVVEEAMAGGTPRLGCPCDDQRERQPVRGTVSDNSLGMPSVEGTLSHSGITGLDVADAPALSGGGPQSVPSRISVVLVDEANAGGTPRWECRRDDQDIRSLAGVAKPASVTVYDDGLRSPCVGGGGDVVLFRYCREAPSGRAYWGVLPSWPYRP